MVHVRVRLADGDSSADARSQGYGLTLQQGLKYLGIIDEELIRYFAVNDSPSSSHFIFNSTGQVVSFFGPAFAPPATLAERQADEARGRWRWRNVHTPRARLRSTLLSRVPTRWQWWGRRATPADAVAWLDKADVVVGADGIYSAVRQAVEGTDTAMPLRYLGVIVILGIVDVDAGAVWDDRIVQVVDGSVRCFTMPYAPGQVMWQLSWPMEQAAATDLRARGSAALHAAALQAVDGWADELVTLLARTDDSLVTGTPVFDRPADVWTVQPGCERMTLIGDAAHPMSPFKGQGANVALADGVLIADTLLRAAHLPRDELGAVLRQAEADMMRRVSSKVAGSHAMALRLHSEAATEADAVAELRGTPRAHVDAVREAGIGLWTGDRLEAEVRRVLFQDDEQAAQQE